MSDSEYTDADGSSTDEEAQEEDLRRLSQAIEPELHASCSTESISVDNDLAKAEKSIDLNKKMDDKYMELQKVLHVRLKECRNRLADIRQTSTNQLKNEKREQVFRYVFCGKPYFRDKDNFPAPDNEDTITMQESGMYDYSNIACLAGWTVKDKQDLLAEILKMSRKIRKTDLESKLKELTRQAKKKDSKSLQKEIIEIKKQINNISKSALDKDIVLPLDQEYDWETIAIALNYRHTPDEYRSIWKLFLHPSINKQNWSKTEHAQLREIALQHELQDWDKIAKELGTGRSGYQCFVYYRTNMGGNSTGQKWSKEEEEYLRRLIDYYKEDNYIPWGKVSSSMENRTKIQIYNKFARLMEFRKGRFLPEEDTVLLTGVKKFGPNFKQIAKYVPGRSSSQLRARYHVLNSTTQTSVVWTCKEDEKLISLMANQDSSINYANLTPHFPDKDRNQLRARYVTLVKWMKKHPTRDISRAPRRGARRLTHGKLESDMTLAVEKLKKRIKCEIDTKRSKKITKDSPEEMIEHGIIAALITENVKEEELEPTIPDHELSDVDMQLPLNTKINETNLRKLLIFLKARIKKQTFETSLYAGKYPSLKHPDSDSFTVKVKSYSRKAATNTITVGTQMHPPDIWGNNRLTTSNFVLPPNYSTITGCRKIMAFASDKTNPNSKSSSLHQYIKRNVLVKEQVRLFMDRFNTLFLWPMLLSNETPRQESEFKPAPMFIETHVKRREHMKVPMGYNVVLPDRINSLVNERIDLPSTSEVATTVKPLIGNDDYLYIDNDVEEEVLELDDDETEKSKEK
ncbi:myb-like DNA-binding domain-containing protein [Phthorimaea operculella]|nr:myb-like DNA-binding domain-containing protein [Phthorimaea operculella]